MTDIVERLRGGFICREEAADEIERLRAAHNPSAQTMLADVEDAHRHVLAAIKELAAARFPIPMSLHHAAHALHYANIVCAAPAEVRDAFIAGFEAFPGPTGRWDREKIRKNAERLWLEYTSSVTRPHHLGDQS